MRQRIQAQCPPEKPGNDAQQTENFPKQRLEQTRDKTLQNRVQNSDLSGVSLPKKTEGKIIIRDKLQTFYSRKREDQQFDDDSKPQEQNVKKPQSLWYRPLEIPQPTIDRDALVPIGLIPGPKYPKTLRLETPLRLDTNKLAGDLAADLQVRTGTAGSIEILDLRSGKPLLTLSGNENSSFHEACWNAYPVQIVLHLEHRQSKSLEVLQKAFKGTALELPQPTKRQIQWFQDSSAREFESLRAPKDTGKPR